MELFSLFKKKTKKDNFVKELTSNVVKSMNQSARTSFSPPPIEVVLKNKLDNGLLPGEIILINWLDNRVELLSFPKYFTLQYGIDPKRKIKRLIKDGFIQYGSNANSLKGYKVSELKEKLSQKSLLTNGKKAELIERLSDNLTNHEIAKLPKSYTVTLEGEKALKTYDYVVKAHSDKYFPVVDAILFKSKNPTMHLYGDLKWTYLNQELNTHNLNDNYGLVRNTLLARADQLHGENKPIDALANLIALQIMDCTGLGNGTKVPYYENIMFAPGIIELLKKYNKLVTDEEYTLSFNGATKILRMIRATGFIGRDDLKLLKSELRNPNQSRLEKHFSKYKKYTIKKRLGL